MHAARDRSRVDERRFGRLQLAQPDTELVERRPGVAGADLPGVAEGALLVVTNEQSTEVRPAAGGIGITANDELLLPDALQLQPVLRATSDVRCVGALGDEPLPAGSAGRGEPPSESSFQASVCCSAELDRIVLISWARRSTNGRPVRSSPSSSRRSKTQ